MSKTITNDTLGGGPITQNNTINVNVIPPGGSLCPLTGTTGSDAFCVKLDTDPSLGPDRLSILYDGIVEFGDGTNPMDTSIERTGVNELTITGGTLNLKTVNTSVANGTTNLFTATNTSAGVNPTYALKSGGQQEFGAGNNPADTFLYRDTANSLTVSTTSGGNPDATLRLGTTYTNSIITNNASDLIILAVGGDINCTGGNLVDVGTLDVGKTSITVNTDAEVAFESGVFSEPYKTVSISGRGEIIISSGFLVPDIYLYRWTNSQMILSSSSLGLPDGTFKTGTFTANNYTSNSGETVITGGSGAGVRIKAPNNTLTLRNNGNYDPFVFDLANYAISITPDGFTADTFIQRTGGGTLTLGTTLGATNGTFSTRTFNANGTLTTQVALQNNVSGDSTQRFVLDMDGQHGWSSGSAARDAWLYRDSANSLTLSTTSRGSSDGTFKTGALRSINYAEINGGVANTYFGTTTQSVFIGQGHDLASPTRALVQGASNTYYRASSSCIIGSTDSVLTTDSSSQSNHAIVACTDVLLGTATGTTGSNCVIICSNGNTGSTIMRNGASRSMLKGHKIECNYSDVVMLADDGVGYTGLKAVGTNNTMECHFKNGYYFTTNALRTAGVQAGSGSTSWSSISDLRLKRNIKPIDLDTAYDAVDKVRVVNFSWKDDVENKQEFGMIAQEVQAAFSDFMPKQHCMSHDYTLQHPDEEPIGTVCGDHIAYLSLGLIKKQKQLINDLKAENMALKDIVIDLIKRVETLENAAAKPARRNAKK